MGAPSPLLILFLGPEPLRRMTDFPFAYEQIAQTTWAYFSALLLLAVFFKFNRFWSIRNLDLLLLLALAPGLMAVTRCEGQLQLLTAEAAAAREGAAPAVADADSGRSPPSEQLPSPRAPRLERCARWGYIWLFAVGGLLLVRLLLDPLRTRRPLLEPNLSLGGLTFLAGSLLIFIVVEILHYQPPQEALDGPREAMQLVQRRADPDADRFRKHGPGLAVLHVLPVIPTFLMKERNGGRLTAADIEIEQVVVAKMVSIALQVIIAAGLVFAGRNLFRNVYLGMAMAVIFLMLPSTAQFAGDGWHMVPAALLLWAVILASRPLVAGVLIGLATGVAYYPLFLLPLWFSFYWPRGAIRLAIGVVGSLLAVILSLVFTVESSSQFFAQLQSMFGFWLPRLESLEGIWRLGWDSWFRLPMLVGFVALSISFVFWPPAKHLGLLIAYSAAILVAVQFWHGYGGGLFVAWYLPLALITFFQANLSEVTAVRLLES